MGPRKDFKKNYVCECLKVTENEVLEAIRTHELEDVKSIVRYTQAGDGCTACHPALVKLCQQERRRAATCSPLPRPSAPTDSSAAQAAL